MALLNRRMASLMPKKARTAWDKQTVHKQLARIRTCLSTLVSISINRRTMRDKEHRFRQQKTVFSLKSVQLSMQSFQRALSQQTLCRTLNAAQWVTCKMSSLIFRARSPAKMTRSISCGPRMLSFVYVRANWHNLFNLLSMSASSSMMLWVWQRISPNST